METKQGLNHFIAKKKKRGERRVGSIFGHNYYRPPGLGLEISTVSVHWLDIDTRPFLLLAKRLLAEIKKRLLACAVVQYCFFTLCSAVAVADLL